MPLFIVILFIGKKDVKCETSRWPPAWEIAVYLAVAGDVFDGVFLCCAFSHEMFMMRSRMNSEGFSTYSFTEANLIFINNDSNIFVIHRGNSNEPKSLFMLNCCLSLTSSYLFFFLIMSL